MFQLIDGGETSWPSLLKTRIFSSVEIVRIRLHLRDQILLDQRGRHGPERVEIDLGRLGLHDRRLAVDLADARDVMGIDDAALDRLDRGGREC